ncbi:Nitrogen regulatory PII-like isoform 2 [Theobroma cacao]|uniref:Nitrogen regulatory PII-like isoform 2 n=1 Tax=Theobroma cacao TaxID=3641 RepID=A0A061FFA3_THECC|nr:Nitrogen regulatory PII-like isoform 2 [Theobroma cacao]
MASTLRCRASSLVSSTTIRRRLPLVGAFCVLSLGFSNLCPTLSSSSNFKTGCAQSLPFVPLLRSKFSTQLPDKPVHAVKMEGSSNTVPSIVVYVTVPNREAGLESVYEWEGKINSDPEELLIIKTRQSLLEALTEHVKANHEYDVPEVIALPITGGSPQYLEWLKNSTRD